MNITPNYQPALLILMKNIFTNKLTAHKNLIVGFEI